MLEVTLYLEIMSLVSGLKETINPKVGVAPVKPPKIIYAQTSFNFSGCPRYMSIRSIQFFTKNNYPEVPRWVRQRRILRILLVTGLVTHI